MALQFRESVQRLKTGMAVAVIIDALHPMLDEGTPRSFRVISQAILLLEGMLASDAGSDRLHGDAQIVLECAGSVL